MASLIRTPDQRLRVFVSSTLGELGAERSAVRAAIERLRLSPVMFELGARPHPPRELYRAYLEQSHVFVGIYWQRYGWIAPGEDISGLEDELRLSGDRPKLLYLKRPAPDQDDRLRSLVAELQDDPTASYKTFETADELARLVEEDLAILLSERFESSTGAGAADVRLAPAGPPVPLTETIGRRADIDAVGERMRAGCRLVTLTGPGGIGKTRIAIEVTREVEPSFADGVCYVALADARDVDGALRRTLDALRIRADAMTPIEALALHLADRNLLLVLDNLEQITEVGPSLVGLLERAPGLRILATSRQALRVRAECDHPVGALAEPDVTGLAAHRSLEPAVRLFVDRARAVSPGFELTDANADVVAAIVRQLDGLPLAIELAAVRIRLFSPESLLERLASGIDVLAATFSDLPDRQQTLRATLDWSHDLLDPAEQALFAGLGVFVGGWTLDAAEAVCAGADVPDVLATTASLIDKSLVVPRADGPNGGEPRFRMLETVRAYAKDLLGEAGDPSGVRDRHLDWCRALARRAQPHLCGPDQRVWVERMTAERANLGAAVERAFELGRDGVVVDLAWDVIVLYFVRDAVAEPDAWLRRVAERSMPMDVVTSAKARSLLALTRIHHGDYENVHDSLTEPLRTFRERGMDFEAAVVLHQLGFVRFAVDDDVDGAIGALEESSRLFAGVHHDWGVALAEAMLGSVFAAIGDLDRAERSLDRSLRHARTIDSDQQVVQALGQLALVRAREDRFDDALALLRESIPLVERHRYRVDAANALDVLAMVAHRRGQVQVAATALGAADAARARLGIEPWPTLQPLLAEIREDVLRSLGPDAYTEIAEAPSSLRPFETLREAFASVGGA